MVAYIAPLDWARSRLSTSCLTHPLQQLIAITGGNTSGDECAALAYHGFNGTEQRLSYNKLSIGSQSSAGLTLRSSGPPPGWHFGPRTLAADSQVNQSRFAGQALTRRRPLSSNYKGFPTFASNTSPWVDRTAINPGMVFVNFRSAPSLVHAARRCFLANGADGVNTPGKDWGGGRERRHPAGLAAWGSPAPTPALPRRGREEYRGRRDWAPEAGTYPFLIARSACLAVHFTPSPPWGRG